MPTIYLHPKCSTCKKAVAWLEERDVKLTVIDIRETPPPAIVYERAIANGIGLRRLFNTSGQDYRASGLKEKLETMTPAAVIKVLTGKGMLCRRPVVVDSVKRPTKVTVGFDEAAFGSNWG